MQIFGSQEADSTISKYKIIPLCKPIIGDDDIGHVIDALISGQLSHGNYNELFEDRFAKYIGVKHAISVNSCTSALHLALAANDIKGRVLVPSFSFAASANAIITSGAYPKFVDINVNDRMIDINHAEAVIDSSVEALMVVHFAGQCANMDEVTSFCEKHGLLLIEDSAECIGGTFKNKMAGSFGIGCFSFFPTKNMTTGEGGMITCNDDALANELRLLRGHGVVKSGWSRSAIVPGYNYRLSNILAALGFSQLQKLDVFNCIRRKHARFYNTHLEGVTIPQEMPNRYHTYQMYTILVENRDEIIKLLAKDGIESSVHFAPPIHMQPAHIKYDELPNTEYVSDHILSLPIYPSCDLDCEIVCRCFNAIKKVL